MMRAPLPANISVTAEVPFIIPQYEYDGNSMAIFGTYQPSGAINTAEMLSYKSLGTRGCACITAMNLRMR